MRFTPTELAGVVVVEGDRHTDERGWFERTFDADAFAEHGLVTAFVQSSLSHNVAVHTLRGLHLQRAPFAEAKLIRCTSGRAWDVAVDLRPASPTFGQWAAVVLEARTGTAVYLPEGIAHGFLTLEPATELSYQISVAHHPEAALGVRWDDADLAIAWPAPPAVLSDRDRQLPPLRDLSIELEEAR